ncbi:MAG: tandem-95 repeat protein [Bacteroidales bacterium]|nr:tandem-95 repeat protein [Bacteroidales bacterium]
MKTQLKILIFLLVFPIIVFSQNQTKKAFKILDKRGEVYFKFPVQDRTVINEITKQISIDDIDDSFIYANANIKEFKEFLKLGYSFDIIERNIAKKSLTMATTVAEMANWDRYPTYEVFNSMMNQFATDYPDICQIHNLGLSVDGRDILCVKISDNPSIKEIEPEFLYTGQMHGDEIVDYILFLRLIDYMLENYGINDQVTNLINNVEIWINPLSNPDGTYHGGNSSVSGAIRRNANSVDLNRNYPDPQDGQHPDGNSWQPETVVMMNFADEHNFVLSANSHSGAECVNYPWDTWATRHADDDWWQYVSNQYADTVQANSTDYFDSFGGTGITNGWDWYTINGGRQDYMNYFKHCREFTLELSDVKMIACEELPAHWNYNKQAFLNYIEQSLYGIRGVITDVITYLPVKAKVTIVGHEADSSEIYSDSINGNYHRPIIAGTYDLEFSAPGYYTQVSSTNIQVYNEQATYLNIQLQPIIITNYPPVIVNEAEQEIDTLFVTTYRDSSISVHLNIYDQDNDNVDVSYGISLSGHGNVVIAPSGDTSFVYTPNSEYVGIDYLKIVVSDDGDPVLTDTVIVKVNVICPENNPPVIVDDEGIPVDTLSYNVIQDSLINICLNINDPDGDDVYITSGISLNEVGDVSFETNDTCFIYTPNSGFIGNDFVQIVVSDNACQVLTDTVIIELTIIPNGENPPVIVDTENIPIDYLEIYTFEDTSITVRLNVIDNDGNDVDVTNGISISGNGSVQIEPYNDTSFVFIPNAEYFGNDTLQIIVSDNSELILTDTLIVYVTIYNHGANSPEIVDENNHSIDSLEFIIFQDSVLLVHLNIFDPDGDTVDVCSGISLLGNGEVTIDTPNDTCFTYIPNSGFVGNDILEIVVCDNSEYNLTDTIIVSITLESNNNAPVIVDTENIPIDYLEIYTFKDTSITVRLNVIDNDGDDVDVTNGISLSGNGSVQIEPYNDTSFVFIPNAGYFGNDTLQIIVSDNCEQVLTDTLIVYVTIYDYVANPPEIVDEDNHPIDSLEFTIFQDSAISVHLNVFDPDGDTVDVCSGISLLGNGEVIIAPPNDTCFTYVPNSGFVGNDILEIVVCDNSEYELTDTVIVSINVELLENHAPVIVDSIGIPIDTLSRICYKDSILNICLNVNDEDDDIIEIFSAISLTGNGSIEVDPLQNLCFIYTPDTGFEGKDTLEIIVCDDGVPVLCDTLSIYMDVIKYNSISEFIINSINDINIYPNPFGTTINIEFNLYDNTDIEIVIVNIFGEKIAAIPSKKYSSGFNKFSYNTENLSDGIYVVLIKSKDITFKRKIVKVN